MHARSIPVVMLSLALLACEGTHHVSSPPLQGRVIDESGAPIEGAIVYAQWSADQVPETFTAHNSPHVCYHAESAASSADGAFTIPGWTHELDIKVSEPTSSIAAYKRGYVWARTDKQIVRMAALSGGVDRQIDAMDKAVTICGEAGMSERNLYLLIKTIYDDARALPQSESQQQLVGRLRRSAAIIWVRAEPNLSSEEFDRKVTEFSEENLK